MTGDTTAREKVEAIIHDQEFQRIPSSPGSFKPIGIVNLPTQLPDDSLHDVACPGHPRVIQMRPQIPKLGLKDKQDSAQPLTLKCLALSGVFLKIVLQLILVLYVKKLVSHLKKGLAVLVWNPQLVLQVVAQKALHMPHTELKRHRGIDDPAGPHQPQISINDKALDRVADGVPQGLKSGNPVLGIFSKMKASVGDVLSVHIPA